ncbi:hypothetical protein HK098_005155 [Nowakowskiella sp. JEL0407]|nr:hypothetical protein HK098_005155 [Nowakowskiella sp. JEL0407]
MDQNIITPSQSQLQLSTEETEQFQPFTPLELLLASETLENIVAEGTLVGARRSRPFANAVSAMISSATSNSKQSNISNVPSMTSLASLWSSYGSFSSSSSLWCSSSNLSAEDVKDGGSKERVDVSERVLRLVYGTMKYLTYIDTILVKTQFLVYNNQFLNHLGLVKILIYELMKRQFNFHSPLVLYHTTTASTSSTELPAMQKTTSTSTLSSSKQSSTEELSPEFTLLESMNELVRDLSDSLFSHKTKLAAAFARIRIERRASGDCGSERLENILPEDVRAKENVAVEMPKYLRVNTLLTTPKQISSELLSSGYQFSPQEIQTDAEFPDLFIVSSPVYDKLKNSPMCLEGRLVFQDKCTLFAPKHLEKYVFRDLEVDSLEVIEARAGCGVRVSHISSLMKNKGKIFAFENRISRLESLKARLSNQSVQNVEVIEEDFLACDPNDSKYANVKIIICEPANSGSAIIDKLGFLLQEEEFPIDSHSQKDLLSLKHQQLLTLKHAFKFPNVTAVLYITRSIQKEENESVVDDILETSCNDWDLSCVLPDMISEKKFEYEIEDCLKIRPSDSGNGIYIACFQRIVHPASEKSDSETDTQQPDLPIDPNSTKETKKSTKKHRKQKSTPTKSQIEPGKLEPERKVEKGLKKKKSTTEIVKKLPKHIAESVERLLSKSYHRETRRLQKKKNKSFNKKESKESLNTDTHSDTEASEDDNPNKQKRQSRKKGTHKSEEEEKHDLEVLGLSMSTFYAPQIEALKQITSAGGQIPKEFEGKDVLSGSRGIYSVKSLSYYMNQARWKYPVKYLCFVSIIIAGLNSCEIGSKSKAMEINSRLNIMNVLFKMQYQINISVLVQTSTRYLLHAEQLITTV